MSSDEPRLLKAVDAGAPRAVAAPFVIAIVNGGIPVLPHKFSAVILSSAWSAGNAFFYSSTRVLHASALDRKAPRFLAFSRFGVPYACVAATTLLSFLAYINVSTASAQVFFWFSNISAVSTLIVWCSINITSLRFFYSLRHNDISRSSLPWKAPLQPFPRLPWHLLLQYRGFLQKDTMPFFPRVDSALRPSFQRSEGSKLAMRETRNQRLN